MMNPMSTSQPPSCGESTQCSQVEENDPIVPVREKKQVWRGTRFIDDGVDLNNVMEGERSRKPRSAQSLQVQCPKSKVSPSKATSRRQPNETNKKALNSMEMPGSHSQESVQAPRRPSLRSRQPVNRICPSTRSRAATKASTRKLRSPSSITVQSIAPTRSGTVQLEKSYDSITVQSPLRRSKRVRVPSAVCKDSTKLVENVSRASLKRNHSRSALGDVDLRAGRPSRQSKRLADSSIASVSQLLQEFAAGLC
jgi:hypothetical protein